MATTSTEFYKPITFDAKGTFKRADSQFRNWVTPDGRPGPSGEGGFKAETDRYHLYVSHACPWAHRTIIFRRLKGLDDAITVSVVNADMGQNGWTFHDGPGVVPDSVNGAELLSQIYYKVEPEYGGRYTVPVLWDKKRGTLVSNESSEIIRMLNSAFDGVGASGPDFYPDSLRAGIDEINADIYSSVNNGVYKSGFARTQESYETAAWAVFECLDRLDARLGSNRYLVGDTITEADWRLFTTLIRFDTVYYSHFKCNIRRIADYPHLSGYVRELYQWPGVKETVEFDNIKRHYFGSHESINPTRIVPIGPDIDFDTPHARDGI